jgi:uncharacterized membrane protein
MRLRPHLPIGRLVAILAAAVVLRVTAAVVAGYGAYFPPDFTSTFLWGRERYFFGAYRWAFTAHILSGPLALVLGLALVWPRFRAWHRRLGRVQGVVVLGLVAPSGLVMARHAAAGPVAGVGLAALAVLTAATCALGWRAARARRFPAHRRWMGRCSALLVSAVVLRLMGGLGTVLGVSAPWYDPLANWLCWLAPLAAFEAWERGWMGGLLPRPAVPVRSFPPGEPGLVGPSPRR